MKFNSPVTLAILICLSGCTQYETVPPTIGNAKANSLAVRQIPPDTWQSGTTTGLISEFNVDIDELNLSLAALNTSRPIHVGYAQAAPTISITQPNGEQIEFKVYRTYAMSEGLAKKYPGIQTYRGMPVDDQNEAELRHEITPLGFHAEVFSPYGSHVISPNSVACKAPGAMQMTLAVPKASLIERKSENICRLTSQIDEPSAEGALFMPELRWGTELKVFRLAVAATSEYTKSMGGTRQCAMAAIASTINRVNQIYERELSISFELVEDNEKIIFEEKADDPFAGLNTSELIDKSQEVIDRVIGSENYDIGHTFSTTAGGLAQRGAGSPGIKALGVSGSSDPSHQNFYVDFVAHEIGHQLGAEHTFNGLAGDCSRRNWYRQTAYEPGSGSTIMSYAGNCHDNNQNDNVIDQAEPYFHSVSLLQISHYLAGVEGIKTIATGNPIPTIEAYGNYVIPIDTPFYLQANVKEVRKDNVAYTFEQLDRGSQTYLSARDNGASPLFRSMRPMAVNYREFGAWSDRGELLPAILRNSNFRATARSRYEFGAYGVGTVASDTVVLTFDDSGGPFAITQPAQDRETINSGSYDMRWDVAGTDKEPFNAEVVNISASDDGGYEFNIVLARETPNDGDVTIAIPPNIESIIIRMESIDNVFFHQTGEILVNTTQVIEN